MRETDIVAWGGIGSGGESLTRGSLDLFNQDIAGSTRHTLTFIVRDDGVVGPDIGITQDGLSSNITWDSWDSCGIGTSRSGNVIKNQKFSPVSETEVDSHIIVWKGSSGEMNLGLR